MLTLIRILCCMGIFVHFPFYTFLFSYFKTNFTVQKLLQCEMGLHETRNILKLKIITLNWLEVKMTVNSNVGLGSFQLKIINCFRCFSDFNIFFVGVCCRCCNRKMCQVDHRLFGKVTLKGRFQFVKFCFLNYMLVIN